MKPILSRILVACVALVLLGVPRGAEARVRLENICTIQGQKEVRLTGLGLVVGLNGTGDGGKNLPTIRALASALKLMNNPVAEPADLKNANNVAVVLIEATIPRTGLRRGQRIDCHVSSLMGAKSLRGGRLLVAPVETAEIANDLVIGLASGPIYIEDVNVSTTGRIPQGLILEQDVASLFVDREHGDIVTLLLDAEHAGFHTSSEVARVVNAEFTFEVGGRQLARAVGPGVIEVSIPEQYRQVPVDFIAQVLDVGIDNPHTQARVVVNAKTGTIVVTGEVEITPVVISHKNLNIEIGNPAPVGGVPFVSVDQERTQPQQSLKQLVDALNQLRVPPAEVIAILRELHSSGKLHAVFVEK